MADLRASDADRELIVEGLRTHHAAGRLDNEELEERLGDAYAARTRGELTRIVADLPAPEAPARPALPAPPNSYVMTVDGEADAVWRLIVNRAVPELVGHGHGVRAQQPGSMIAFDCAYRPWWIWLIVVFTFPVGLLALLIKQHDPVVVSLANDGTGRTQLTITGTERADVVRALVSLRYQP